MCGERRDSGKRTYNVDLGTGVVVVRNVPAEICTQCGEEWIGPEVAKASEQIVEKAHGGFMASSSLAGSPESSSARRMDRDAGRSDRARGSP